MNKNNKFSKARELFAETFELPKDVVLDIPRISIVGNIQFYVENYRGLIEYSEKSIRLAIRKGEIVINGDGLRIKNINHQEILIEGKIESIYFQP